MNRIPRGCPLSARELSILRLLAEGLVYKQIAERLHLSTSTIRTHLHNIYMKLGARDRAQAVLIASEEAWLDNGYAAPLTREARLLRTIEHLLEDLIEAVAKRRERLHITPSQDRYLAAFEEYLHEPLATISDAKRLRMVRRLHDVLDDAGIDIAHIGQQRRAA
jgi:DNA-binding CsgD family transcriptional regulator